MSKLKKKKKNVHAMEKKVWSEFYKNNITQYTFAIFAIRNFFYVAVIVCFLLVSTAIAAWFLIKILIDKIDVVEEEVEVHKKTYRTESKVSYIRQFTLSLSRFYISEIFLCFFNTLQVKFFCH